MRFLSSLSPFEILRQLRKGQESSTFERLCGVSADLFMMRLAYSLRGSMHRPRSPPIATSRAKPSSAAGDQGGRGSASVRSEGVYGKGGWYSEVPEAKDDGIMVPKSLLHAGPTDFMNEVLPTISQEKRVRIQEPSE